MKGCLQKAKKLLDEKKEVKRMASDYYLNERNYYMATRQYSKALSVQEHISQTIWTNQSGRRLRNTAIIYQEMGNNAKAVEYYQAYIQKTDSANRIYEDIAAGEFSAILGVEKLNIEKAELQQEAQQRDLANKQRIIILLVVLLVLGAIFFYREHLLNGKLRHRKKPSPRRTNNCSSPNRNCSSPKSVPKSEHDENRVHTEYEP